MKQEQIAKKVGKNRASVANYMRLLKLSRYVKEDIVSGKLSMGHARALLGVEKNKDIEMLRQKILKKNLNVRQTENLVKQTVNKIHKKSVKTRTKVSKHNNIFLKSINENLEKCFGTKVEIVPDNKKGGKVIISYYSDEDLERLQESFCKNT